jgi:hypothetical protein
LKKALIVLGNGLSIDCLTHVKAREQIDTVSLFRRGAEVLSPEGDDIGFLSRRFCPALWSLGVRPHLDARSAISIVERVLSAAQAFVQHRHRSAYIESDGSLRPELTHLRAYCELAHYLRQLFLMYDSEVKESFSKNAIESWKWALFFQKLQSEAREIVVVNYNYDLFLERALTALDIPFVYAGLNEDVDPSNASKIKIYKPHGSINFVGKDDVAVIKSERPPREIDYRLAEDLTTKRQLRVQDFQPEDFWLRYSGIPPAGESARLGQSWNKGVHQKILDQAKTMQQDDLFVACGVSYWHVDRSEIDSIIAELHPEVRAYMVNPAPSPEFDSVLSSLFRQYTCFGDGSSLLKVKL